MNLFRAFVIKNVLVGLLFHTSIFQGKLRNVICFEIGQNKGAIFTLEVVNWG